MGYFFDEDSASWLKKQNFSNEEIKELADFMGRLESRHEKGEEFYIRVPAEMPKRFSAMVYMLNAVTDVEGKPICFKEGGMLSIPGEIRNNFREGLVLEEFESAVKRAKTGSEKHYSYPKRRGMHKG